jgi:hypothetical protein
MKFLIICLGSLITSMAVANGFQCKEDLRPNGDLRVLTFSGKSNSYSLTYVVISEGRGGNREEYNFLTDGKCDFSGRPRNITCYGDNTLVKMLTIPTRIIVEANIYNETGNISKEISFDSSNCMNL